MRPQLEALHLYISFLMLMHLHIFNLALNFVQGGNNIDLFFPKSSRKANIASDFYYCISSSMFTSSCMNSSLAEESNFFFAFFALCLFEAGNLCIDFKFICLVSGLNKLLKECFIVYPFSSVQKKELWTSSKIIYSPTNNFYFCGCNCIHTYLDLTN